MVSYVAIECRHYYLEADQIAIIINHPNNNIAYLAGDMSVRPITKALHQLAPEVNSKKFE